MGSHAQTTPTPFLGLQLGTPSPQGWDLTEFLSREGSWRWARPAAWRWTKAFGGPPLTAASVPTSGWKPRMTALARGGQREREGGGGFLQDSIPQHPPPYLPWRYLFSPVLRADPLPHPSPIQRWMELGEEHLDFLISQVGQFGI